MIDELDPPPASRAAPESDLEARVRKLEVAVAEQRALALDEDAVADRVIAKLSAMADRPRPNPASGQLVVLDSEPEPEPRPLVPAAPPPPNGAVLRPPAAPADPARRKWFVTQFWSEVRLVFRMYFDPRYRLSRTGQFVLPGIVLLLVFNYFFFSVWVSIAFVSPVVERLLAVLLGIVGYKILVRETARYREVLDYLAKYGQQGR